MKAELTGTIVALDPEKLLEDHSDLLKQPAIIESFDTKRNLALISFADSTQCEIEPDRLIMLKPHSNILMKLIRNWNLPIDDFQIIIKVFNLMQKKAFGDAMELAITNDVVRKRCTMNCQEWLRENLMHRQKKDGNACVDKNEERKSSRLYQNGSFRRKR